ncbi:hypothetical protein [Priestia endophytica]|uniref:hypothetical protein n=1 Tax=Priestia endophytica TaxID=135735 RepID=UPI00227EB550|nr:hypothetical protein [Priestia endophytica]MCY8233362.1 hypothetical protein [Priestia endophytica]
MIENLGRLDIKVSKLLSDRFSQLKENHEEEEEKEMTYKVWLDAKIQVQQLME